MITVLFYAPDVKPDRRRALVAGVLAVLAVMVSPPAVRAWVYGGGSAPRNQTPMNRVVPQDRGHDISVNVPLATGADFEREVTRVASASTVTVGLELVADENLQARTNVRAMNPQIALLNGRTVGAALNVLATSIPADGTVRYAGSGVQVSLAPSGVIHVSAFAGKPTFLDTMIPSFVVEQQTLSGCLQAVHRLFDPNFPSGTPSFTRSVILPSDPAAAAARLVELGGESQRRVSASLANVTVRDILDAVATLGQASWVVTYADPDGAYSHSRIGYRTFQGDQNSLAARK